MSQKYCYFLYDVRFRTGTLPPERRILRRKIAKETEKRVYLELAKEFSVGVEAYDTSGIWPYIYQMGEKADAYRSVDALLAGWQALCDNKIAQAKRALEFEEAKAHVPIQIFPEWP